MFDALLLSNISARNYHKSVIFVSYSKKKVSFLRCSVLHFIMRLHCLNSYMQPIATDGIIWSLCLLVTFVSPGKTVEDACSFLSYLICALA